MSVPTEKIVCDKIKYGLGVHEVRENIVTDIMMMLACTVKRNEILNIS